MSIHARQALCARLTFADTAAKADLLDPARTNTVLIQLLIELAAKVPEPLYITSVRADHGDDGASLHSHASGDAADLWVAPTLPDAAIRDVLVALRGFADEGVLVEQVGLGGAAKAHDPGGWPAGFDLFEDDDQDHVHISAFTPAEEADAEEERRAQA